MYAFGEDTNIPSMIEATGKKQPGFSVEEGRFGLFGIELVPQQIRMTG